MELIEAKEAVAFKYFREKWVTLSLSEKVKHMDEVAELYAEAKVKNVSSNSCVSCRYFQQSAVGGFGNCKNKDFNRFIFINHTIREDFGCRFYEKNNGS